MATACCKRPLKRGLPARAAAIRPPSEKPQRGDVGPVTAEAVDVVLTQSSARAMSSRAKFPVASDGSEGGQAVPPEQPQPVVEGHKDAARVPHEFAAGQLER